MTRTRRGSTATSPSSGRAGRTGPIALALLLGACTGSGSDRPDPPRPPHAATALAQFLLQQILTGDSIHTLGEWQRRYPAAALVRDSVATSRLTPPQYCAQGTRTPTDPRLGTEEVFFVIPVPARPMPLYLEPIGPALADSACQFGLRMLILPEPDSVASTLLLQSLTGQLLARGAVRTDSFSLGQWGVFGWHQVRGYRLDSLVVALAREPLRGEEQVRILLELPAALRAESLMAREGLDAGEAWAAHWQADADRAVAASGHAPPLTVAFTAARREAEAWNALWEAGRAPARPLPAERLTRLLTEWLRDLEQAPPPVRASRLYAADLLLASAIRPFGLGDSTAAEARHALATVGAPLRYEPYNDAWEYDHALLERAHVAEPGRVTPWAIHRLSFGVPLLVSCLEGDTAYTRTLAQVDELAPAADGPAARVALHLFAADAARDRVAIATGIQGDQLESGSLPADNAGVRRRALRQLEMARAADPDSPLLHQWASESFRLAAGLRPRQDPVYCTGD